MQLQPFHDQRDHTVSRIGYIDFIKVIGLAGIIAAHTGPPSWVIMLRCFDVPLMVILSAMLGERSFARRAKAGKPLHSYYLSRVKRLVFPTWVFLGFYFLFQFLIEGTVYSLRYYVDSFLLTHYGIGYVWIILIYLYSALVIPFFFLYSQKKGIWICIAVVYLLYEVAYHLHIGTDCRLVMNTFYDFVPYGLGLTYLGCTVDQMSRQGHIWVAAAALLVFTGMVSYYRLTQGVFLSVQNAKYPARLYYLSYGVGCSYLLLTFCEKVHLQIFRFSLVHFISAHSLWIYLWHIFVLDVYRRLHLPEHWAVTWLIVFTVSVLIVLLINQILDDIEKRNQLPWLWLFRG